MPSTFPELPFKAPGPVVSLLVTVVIMLAAIPVMVLVLAATLTVAMVLGLVAIGYRLRERVRSAFPRRDGRQNVRVIER